jgi:hypothetical protein
MKRILKMVLEVIIGRLFALVGEIELNGIIKEIVNDWCDKHLTPAELTSEATDLKKLLEDKWNINL